MVHAETIMSAHPDNPDGYRAAGACAQVAHDPRANAFNRVADALANYHEEAVPDVWSGFVPPAGETHSTPPPLPDAQTPCGCAMKSPPDSLFCQTGAPVAASSAWRYTPSLGQMPAE